MAGLKVKVNTDRSEGNFTNDDTNSLLKDILRAIEAGNKGEATRGKLDRAGLGVSSLTGGLKGFLATLIGGAATIGIGEANAGQKVGFGDQTPAQRAGASGVGYGSQYAIGGALAGAESNQIDNIFEKVRIDGENYVIEINEKTGEILNVLTEEAAVKAGILDINKKIKMELQTENSIFDNMTSNLESTRDALVLTGKDVDSIAVKTDAEKKLRQEIIELLAAQRDRLATQEARAAILTSDSILNLGKGPITAEYAYKVAYEEALVVESPTAKDIRDNVLIRKPFFNIGDFTRTEEF